MVRMQNFERPILPEGGEMEGGYSEEMVRDITDRYLEFRDQRGMEDKAAMNYALDMLHVIPAGERKDYERFVRKALNDKIRNEAPELFPSKSVAVHEEPRPRHKRAQNHNQARAEALRRELRGNMEQE